MHKIKVSRNLVYEINEEIETFYVHEDTYFTGIRLKKNKTVMKVI